MKPAECSKKKSVSRREFIKTSSSVALMASLPAFMGSKGSGRKRNKMILSFYMDDTNPEIVKAEAFRYFLDFCNGYGIKGESSVILGYGGSSIIQDPSDNHKLYLWQAKQAYNKGIDTHMEIMTHSTLFNFSENRKNESGIHEGLWLHEPSVTKAEYLAYFSSILDEGEKGGIRFTGLTWPGCGCEVCTARYAELRKEGPLHISQAAFDALLDMASQGRFRTRVLPVFYESSETDYGIYKRAAGGKYGVYDLMPNCQDQFGIWENSQDHVDPDYYLTGDGKAGIIKRHFDNNAPYCMWYMHWQGLNPENGKGWKAFQTVTERIRKHFSGKVVWMRPSEIVTAYHDAGGWGFTNKL